MSEGTITGITTTASGLTAYIDPDDFRTASLKWYCVGGLSLTTSEAGDTILEQAIAHVSTLVDSATDDHFLSEELTLELRGTGGGVLYLPKRTRSVSAVKTRDHDGVLTAEVSTAYRLCSSLDSAGTDFSNEHTYDYLTLIPEEVLTDGTAVWPHGNQTVQVTGAFGWAATPEPIKRVCALMVYDIIKPKSPDLRRASRWQTQDASFDASQTEPTGIPEADMILKAYMRPEPPV